MVKKTYKELLEGLKYSDLGYTGERKPLTDPKYKQFTDTINKNAVIANTHIDSSLPTMPQAQVNGQGTTIPTAKVDGQNPWAKNRRNNAVKDTKSTEASTVGSDTTVGGSTPETVPTTDTPLTIDAKYSDFTKWAKEHGVDSDKVFQDAMALARTQYEQARATYGLQAEQLAQAGLTNSGVSDNMERVAYAQKVQAEQAALDQKAALDLTNKQAYGAYKDQQKQQYSDLFQKYVFGYEDEGGNIHAPVSPDEAEALLKLAGLNDEAMIADIRKSYDEYKGIGDKKAQEQQFAIAGIDSTTGGFSADSMFGKLFSGDLSSEDFLNDVSTKYDIQASTDEEAVDALLASKAITKDMASMYYRKRAESSLEAISELDVSAKSMLRDADSELFNAVYSAHDAYKAGKMSQADWNAFKSQLFSGNGDGTFKVTYELIDGGLTRKANFTYEVGGTSYTVDISGSIILAGEADKVNKASKGGNFAVVDDELYIRIGEGTSWFKASKVYGKGQKNLKAMLKMLAE